MKEFFLAVLLGVIAGVIDILPMLKRENIPKSSIVFVFTQWVLLGALIPFVDWPISGWLKGLIIGVLGMLPVMILTYPRNPKAIPSILICAMPLGAAIGWFASRMI